MLPTPQDAVKNTMQALPDAQKDGGLTASFWAQYTRSPVLSPFGTRRREQDLRRIWRHDYNTAIRGAFTGIATEFASKKYKITAPETLDNEAGKYYRATAKALNIPSVESAKRPDIAYFDHILRYADFGRGWASFVQKFVLDYLRQDGGGFVEVIAPGKATKAPKGAISGLSALDSLRCWPTGDPEYPVVYWNRKAEYHLIHASRVIQFQDMPDSDEMIPGYGMCALSRSIAVAYREILMAQYIEVQLDDKPPPGIINASNMNEAARDRMLSLYRRDQSTDSTPEWGKMMFAFPLDPSLPMKLEMLQFNIPPEKFDWKVYTELDIDLLALAIGVDRQDLWQLTGGSGISGSKGQSETLSQKSRGKMKGLLAAEIKRKINDLLPDEFEFNWDETDPQAETEKATNAQTWAGVATSLASLLSPDQQLTLVSNQSEEIRDVVTDENGQLLSIEDGDIQTAQQIQDDAAALHAIELASTPPPIDPNKPANGGAASKPVSKRPNVGRGNVSASQKAIDDDIETAFEDEFAQAVNEFQAGVITSSRLGIKLRDMLSRYGLKMLKAGLAQSGLETVDPDGTIHHLQIDERRIYDDWLLKQSYYISKFVKKLGEQEPTDDHVLAAWWLLLPLGAAAAGTLAPWITSPIDSKGRAALWVRKSLGAIKVAGTMLVDKNGRYEFQGHDGEESCVTCQRLKGQVHRYKDWYRAKLIPQVDTFNFECGGWHCEHGLKRTSALEQGIL